MVFIVFNTVGFLTLVITVSHKLTNIISKEDMSQYLTFLHLVRSPSQSTRLIWWAHAVSCTANVPKGIRCPRWSVPHTTHMDGHNFVTVHMRDAVPPQDPYKSGCLGPSQSVSPWLLSHQHCPRSLAVTFPWLCLCITPAGQLVNK